jgi:hypothetical protein
MSAAAPTVPRSAFAQVIVASGHLIDGPERSSQRFPPSAEAGVAAAVSDALRDWSVDEDTLVITGAARGADIIVAEQAIDLGATVWLLLALPDDEFVEVSVRLAGTDWEARFWELRRRCPTWVQCDELGPAPPGSRPGTVFARNNEWCLEAGRAQAPPDRMRAIVVWNEDPGEVGGTGDFVTRARALGVEVRVIRPPIH